MHRSGGTNAKADQRLCALLTFNQDDCVYRQEPRLVVKRTCLRRSHLASLGIPRPELLLATGWVVAVDDRNQLACGVQVIPLGRGWTEIVDRYFLLDFTHR